MAWEKEYKIPFTNGNKWIEVSFEQRWFQVSFREMYSVAEENRRLLGNTDDRTLFDIGFHVPDLKRK